MTLMKWGVAVLVCGVAAICACRASPPEVDTSPLQGRAASTEAQKAGAFCQQHSSCPEWIAAATTDPAYCDSIADAGLRDRCLEKLALLTKNAAVCDRMYTKNKVYCHLGVAASTDEKAACERMLAFDVHTNHCLSADSSRIGCGPGVVSVPNCVAGWRASNCEGFNAFAQPIYEACGRATKDDETPCRELDPDQERACSTSLALAALDLRRCPDEDEARQTNTCRQRVAELRWLGAPLPLCTTSNCSRDLAQKHAALVYGNWSNRDLNASLKAAMMSDVADYTLWAHLFLGANPDAVTDAGQSLLESAVRRDRVQLVGLLIDAKAKLDTRNERGESLLFFARGGAVAHQLLQRGLPADERRHDGRTPIVHAVIEGARQDLVEALLAAKADPNQLYSPTERLIDHALAVGDLSLANALLKHGAAPPQTNLIERVTTSTTRAHFGWTETQGYTLTSTHGLTLIEPGHTEIKIEDLSFRQVEADLELGENAPGPRVRIRVANGATVKFEVREQTTMSIGMEGPHYDLTNWKHGDSGWKTVPLDRDDLFDVSKVDTKSVFPSYTEDEVVEAAKGGGLDEVYLSALRRIATAGEGAAGSANTETSSTSEDDPARYMSLQILTSDTMWRISIKDGDGWRPVRIIHWQWPMGC